MIRTKQLFVATIAGLLLVHSAFAQDAAAPIRRGSPSPGDETPSATPAATATPPAAIPAPQASATPPPAKPPEPSPAATAQEKAERAGPANTPSRRVIQEAPVRAMTPRPAGSRKPPPTAESADTRPALPPASRPTFDLSDQGSSYVGATIRALENRWQNSIVKHNFGVIEELVADDFIGTSSTGRLGSKSTLLSESRHDKNIYSSAVARGMIVRAYGSDVAVATGVTREAGTTPDGRRFTNARRFTDTWMKRNGRWQCVCSNATELPRD